MTQSYGRVKSGRVEQKDRFASIFGVLNNFIKSLRNFAPSWPSLGYNELFNKTDLIRVYEKALINTSNKP